MFDISEAQKRASRRLGARSTRRRRSDAGKSRVSPFLLDALRVLVVGREQPSITQVERHLAALAAEHRLRPPCRATLYGTLATMPGHFYRMASLPSHVRSALYNLGSDAEVPGHQLAFYCFNYGSPAAASYAAGLPWLDLYQARRMRGWRARSRGLLDAAMRFRGMR